MARVQCGYWIEYLKIEFCFLQTFLPVIFMKIQLGMDMQLALGYPLYFKNVMKCYFIRVSLVALQKV